MTKPETIDGMIQVLMCPHCSDVHLVIIGTNGTVLFNAGFPDEAWNKIFASVATLQRARDNVSIQ